MKIAILGATSHIAMNIIARADAGTELFLFARSIQRASEVLGRLINSLPCCVLQDLDCFETLAPGANAVINCIGFGTPEKIRTARADVFLITEYYDNQILEYLRRSPNTKYICFSSGAVYGSAFNEGSQEESKSTIAINAIVPEDYYRIAKINSEAKHRALGEYSIVDVRVFSFFSRYIDIQSDFLLAEMMRCLVSKKVFETNQEDFVRDFISPQDLYSLVRLYIDYGTLNCALDTYSKEPTRKSELIRLFSEEFGLKVEIKELIRLSSTGSKMAYYSRNHAAFRVLGFQPKDSSISSVRNELREYIDGR